MTAAAANRLTQHKGDMQLQSFPVAATTTIYKDTLCSLNSSGYLVPASDTASTVFMGMSTEKVDNSAGANGDLSCVVGAGFRALFAASSITQALVGTQVEAIDDQTFDETSVNTIAIGKLVEFVSTTSGWVYLKGFTA